MSNPGGLDARGGRLAQLLRPTSVAIAFAGVVATSGVAIAERTASKNEAFLVLTLKRVGGIVDTAMGHSNRFGVPRQETLKLLAQAEHLIKDLSKIENASPELDREKARMRLQIARNFRIVGKTDRQIAHATAAEHLLRALVRRNKKDLEAQGWLSDALGERGDALVVRGDLANALKSYEASLEIRKRLAEAKPKDATWSLSLSAALDKIGDVRVAQNDLSLALDSYEASLAIKKRLAGAKPDNKAWQRDLSVSYNRVGDVLRTEGQLARALVHFQASLAIRQRLGETDKANTGWQRDLAVSHNKVGDLLRAGGKPIEALRHFKASREIFERLTKRNPKNANWQRDLWVSYWRLAKYEPDFFWQKVVSKLEEMDKRGMLLENDRKYMAIAKQALAKQRR